MSMRKEAISPGESLGSSARELQVLEVDTLADSLKTHQDQGEFGEKMLVVQRRSQGRRILQALTRAGITLLNVSVETPLSLATSIYQEKPENTAEILSKTKAESLIWSLLQEKKDGFFVEYQVQSLPVAQALYRTFLELTLGQLRNIPDFSSHSQEASTLELWEDYGKAKAQHNYVDQGDLILYGLHQQKTQQPWGGTTFYTLESDYFSPLERSFLQSCTEKPLQHFCFPQEEAVSALGKQPCHFFSCRGQETEVRQLFRDIIAQNHGVEDCAVVYLDPSYPSMLYQIGPRWGIPVSVSLGLKESLLANTLEKLLEFTQQNFPLETLYHLLTTGACAPDKRKDLAKILHNRPLSFGKELYHCDFDRDTLPFNPDQEQIETFERLKEDNSQNWAAFFHCILAIGEERSSVAEQKEAIRTFLAMFSPLHSVGEGVAYRNLLSLLDHVASVCQEKTSLLARFLLAMEDVSYAPYRNESNTLLCMPLAEAILSGRSHLYVLGLTRYALEQGGNQSPILLDHVRDRFQPPLETVATKSARFTRSFTHLIQGHQGDFTFLYPNFDSNDMVVVNPAPFYEEAVLHCQASPETVEYVPQLVLSPGDMAITQAWSQADYPLPSLNQSQVVETSLATQIQDFVFSASSFEDAHSCPLAFYLKRILKLKTGSLIPPREDIWLPYDERGTFVHTVLDRYYAQVVKGDAVPGVALLDQIFGEYFLKLEEEKPCQPDDKAMVLQKEREKMDLRNWIDNAIGWTKAQSGRTVVETELVFGQDVPLDLQIGHRLVHLKGTIDRIDKEQAEIHVLDYKTGKQDNFRQKDHFQHYLYALAYEAQNPGVTVASAGYLMLNPTAECLQYPLDPQSGYRTEMNQKITALLDILSDEEAIQTPCPCYTYDAATNSLVVGSVAQRKKTHSGCSLYCDYKDFCNTKMEELK